MRVLVIQEKWKNCQFFFGEIKKLAEKIPPHVLSTNSDFLDIRVKTEIFNAGRKKGKSIVSEAERKRAKLDAEQECRAVILNNLHLTYKINWVRQVQEIKIMRIVVADIKDGMQIPTLKRSNYKDIDTIAGHWERFIRHLSVKNSMEIKSEYEACVCKWYGKELKEINRLRDSILASESAIVALEKIKKSVAAKRSLINLPNKTIDVMYGENKSDEEKSEFKNAITHYCRQGYADLQCIDSDIEKQIKKLTSEISSSVRIMVRNSERLEADIWKKLATRNTYRVDDKDACHASVSVLIGHLDRELKYCGIYIDELLPNDALTADSLEKLVHVKNAVDALDLSESHVSVIVRKFLASFRVLMSVFDAELRENDR